MQPAVKGIFKGNGKGRHMVIKDYDVKITGNVEMEFNVLAGDMEAAQKIVAGILFETNLVAECYSDYECMKIYITERFPGRKKLGIQSSDEGKPQEDAALSLSSADDTADEDEENEPCGMCEYYCPVHDLCMYDEE